MAEEIVIGFDRSDGARRALDWAATEAAARGATLRILESWHEPLIGGPTGVAAAFEPEAAVLQVKQDLEHAVARVMRHHPGVTFECELVDARPGRALVDAADRADLVVVGARGLGGFLGLELGSVSSRVARLAPSPVVVVRGQDDRRGQPEIVVGVDGSACSRTALAWAAAEARLRHKRLVVLLAWNYLEPQGPYGPESFRPEYGREDAADALAVIVTEVLGASPDVTVHQVLACDLPARAILERSSEACLIVVGRHGSASWSPPQFGTTGQQVLHHAACPVAVIPVPER